MKFRFLVAALALVIGGAAIFGGRATPTQAVAGGDIQLSCPAIAVQGSPFPCNISLGTMPDPVTGYQFVIIYDSPVAISGAPPAIGTMMRVLSITKNYGDPAVFWGPPGNGEACGPNSINVSNVLLPSGYQGSGVACTALSPGVAPAAAFPNFVTFNMRADGLGFAPVHMVTLAGGGPSFGTFTIDGASTPHTNTYSCGNDLTAPLRLTQPIGSAYAASLLGPTFTLPPAVNCAATGAIFGAPGMADAWVFIVLPPPDVTLTKTASVPNLVLSQSMTFTLTATNTSTTTAAPNVVITDVIPAAFTVGVLPAGCVEAPVNTVTCTTASLAALGVASFIIPVTATSGAGTTVNNCASSTSGSIPADPNAANNTNRCASVQIIPPAVAWSKSPSIQQVFLCESGTPPTNGCTTSGQTGSVNFDEILTNQGDPNGLGAFEFTLHFDNLIFNVPTICNSNPISTCPALGTASFVDIGPATTLFAAAGRTLICSMSLPQETQIHVACASTGPIGVGPVFVGAQIMAHVSMDIKDFVRGSLYPHKENGIVTRFDDTGTELANTCGWPLNDGTGYIVPGQTTECQGVALLGILPGGLVADSSSFVTIRRLEADMDKDCDVDVADMQAMATRYGFGFGSLLYQIWFDLEPHTTGADGDIDIKDVQFVFGRFGSNCTAPIPPQVPQLPVDP